MAGWLRACRTSDGFIVVVVLWIIAAIATLASVYALNVRMSGFAMNNYEGQLRSQALTSAGVELAAWRLTSVQPARHSQGNFSFKLGGGMVTVDYRAESGRVDINLAPKPTLAGLFVALGSPQPQADRIADRIVAWRSPRPAEAADEEAFLYRSAGRGYEPRYAPFQHVNELALVLDLSPALVERALPYVTVYSGQPEINVYSASTVVLNALPGLTPERIALLLAQREGVSQDVIRAQLGSSASYATLEPSRIVHLTVGVLDDANRRMRTEVVMRLLEDGPEPYAILSWREESPIAPLAAAR